ncbi:MAG TPA: thiamine phosphate synthase [Candidatus Acidoferrum sp.]|nr:thiamine phosphate synthase [Candidatus Acidoferrum sp.]
MSRLSNESRVPLLCYVTDRCSLSELQPAEQLEILLSKIGAAAEAGLDWIQIREKDFSGKECSSLTREALLRAVKSSANKTSPTRIIVNDRLDVALAERAGGVHLGEKSLPRAEALRRVASGGERKDFLVGVSCHSLEAARVAASGGADYLFFGPVFATPSKAAFGGPQGLGQLAEVCRAVAIPVLAIGGIALANAADCLSAGASGIAAIRLFQDARDISSLVQSLRKLKA